MKIEKVISKNLIVMKKKSYVLFVEYMGSVYSIICGPGELRGKIRSNLMETKLKKESNWGEINYKNVVEYTFDKGFYYWLLDVKGQILATTNKSMKIEDVRGFKSNSERKTCSFNGQGNNIDKRLPMMSIIGMNERVTNLYINIIYNNIKYSFDLAYNSELEVFELECGNFTSTPSIHISIKDLMFSIYFDIIPFLKQQYNVAINKGWQNDELRFRKESSLKIIMQLMCFNGINIKDLETAMSGIDN